MAGPECKVEGCGKESCATVHMVNDASGGHDFRPFFTMPAGA